MKEAGWAVSAAVLIGLFESAAFVLTAGIGTSAKVAG